MTSSWFQKQYFCLNEVPEPHVIKEKRQGSAHKIIKNVVKLFSSLSQNLIITVSTNAILALTNIEHQSRS